MKQRDQNDMGRDMLTLINSEKMNEWMCKCKQIYVRVDLKKETTGNPQTKSYFTSSTAVDQSYKSSLLS